MSNRLEILEAIERGDMTVQEGLRRLEGKAESARPEGSSQRTPPPVANPFLVRVVWQAVFWLGVALVAGGGVLVSAVYAWSIWSGWQIIGWVLFAMGVVTMAVGWWMRTARWLSIRIREERGARITLAFPVPFGLVFWALRIARPFVPQLHDVPVEELVAGLEETVRDGEPFAIDVHDEEDGDHVQVYFG